MKSLIQKKKELVKLKDKLSKSRITVFTSFAREGEKGLDVVGMQTLKKGLRKVDSDYVVEKKTLLDKALDVKNKNADVSGKIDVFSFGGSLGVVFGYGEETAIAKSVYDFSRKNTALKTLGAIMGGKYLDGKAFVEFAKLPSREVLIAKILGLMKYPLSAMANVLGQIAKKE